MKNSPFHLSKLVPFLPYLYFIGLAVFNFVFQASKTTAHLNDIKVLILAIPFAVQLIFSFKGVDPLLGAVTFLLAFYLSYAYIADLSKIKVYNTRAINFIVLGGLVVVLNFVMSILLFRNEMQRTGGSRSDGDGMQGAEA